MRTVTRETPTEVVQVATTPYDLPEDDRLAIHFPMRITLGRLESTRLGAPIQSLDALFVRRVTRQLISLARERGAGLIHVVAHGSEFWAAHRATRALGIPLYLSVHDDLDWTLARRLDRGPTLRAFGRTWREAAHRFVISDEMGWEYCERYGERSVTVVTDGHEQIRSAPRPATSGRLRLYFMGSLHESYRPNIVALSRALRQWGDRTGGEVGLVFRGAGISLPEVTDVPLDVRGYGGPDDLERDLEDVDAMYLPLPFAAHERNFIRLSFSTKLVSYLGSGRPILYHGPQEAAAGRVLREHGAAAAAYDEASPDAAIEALDAGREDLAVRALDLARERFDATRIRERLWNPMLAALR